jgi:hypothetical protein
MSASAPLGSPNKTTGNTDADCTSAIITGDVVKVVISHAEATSFIHMQMFAVSHVPHSSRNTGRRKGSQADGRTSVEAGSCSTGGFMRVDCIDGAELTFGRTPQGIVACDLYASSSQGPSA